MSYRTIPLRDAAGYFTDLKHAGWTRGRRVDRAAKTAEAGTFEDYAAREQAGEEAALSAASEHERARSRARDEELAETKKQLAAAEQALGEAEAAVGAAEEEAVASQQSATAEASAHAASRIGFDRMRERLFQVLGEGGSEEPPEEMAPDAPGPASGVSAASAASAASAPSQSPKRAPGSEAKRKALQKAASGQLMAAGALLGGALGGLSARRTPEALNDRKQKLTELAELAGDSSPSYGAQQALRRQTDLVMAAQIAKQHPHRALLSATAKGALTGALAGELLSGVYQRGMEIGELARMASGR